MNGHDIGRLEKLAGTLRESLRQVAVEDEWEELFRHWHQPGYTTPAEFRLVEATLRSLSLQTELVLITRTQLVEASREIVRAASEGVKESEG